MLSKLLVAVSVVIVAWWITLCAPPSAGYNSIIRQSLHYFSRAGGGRVWEEIKHESAWTGAELSSDISRWRLELTSEQQKDILVVVAKLKGLNKKLTDIRKGDAEWPQWMLDTFNKTKFELSSGLGLAVIRGIPVNSMTEDEQQLFWWSVGFELGIPGAQDDDGNLLGHIRDVGMMFFFFWLHSWVQPSSLFIVVFTSMFAYDVSLLVLVTLLGVQPSSLFVFVFTSIFVFFF